MRAAVIDLGTNTFHLIIGDLTDKDLRVVYRTTIPVLLGQARINENMIIPQAFERGIRTLKDFKGIIDAHNVDIVKAIATSAIRNAVNGPDFVRAAQAVGIDIQVITGDEEAAFIFNGVKALGIIQQTSLIMDIGGGSTEFIICNEDGLLWKKSYDLGAARLMQAYFHSDPICNTDRCAIIDLLDKALSELEVAAIRYKPEMLIGSAGAFESFAILLNNGNDIGDTAFMKLDIPAYEQLAARLVASNHEQRTNMKGLISLRVDMIVIAAILTSYILDNIELNALSVSMYDLKMGVLHSIKEEITSKAG